MLRDVEARFDSFVERGSGWVVKKVLQFCLTVNSFKLFKGGCKKGSLLPGRLRMMQSCISINSPPNSDSDCCFLNCLVAGIARVPRNPSRWCAQYLEIEQLLLHCWPNKCSFPVTSHHWKSIDRHCPVSVNIYGYENGVIFPLFLSTYRDSKPFHVDLLLSQWHYFLIRNLAALVSPQTKSSHHKCHICASCLGSYGSWQRYRRHMSLCKNDGTIFEIPELTSPNVSFYNFNNMVTAPFVIYCDMERYIEEEELMRRGKIVSRQ